MGREIITLQVRHSRLRRLGLLLTSYRRVRQEIRVSLSKLDCIARKTSADGVLDQLEHK
jgi:hypothetical protein